VDIANAFEDSVAQGENQLSIHALRAVTFKKFLVSVRWVEGTGADE